MAGSSTTLDLAAGQARAPAAALSAAAVTIPHALGLGLLAFGPLAGDLPVGALALWSAALPGALAALFIPRPGVVYAPTTVVALLYAAVVASLAAAAPQLGMGPAQVLGACGATTALAFGFQWLFGVLRLAGVARFLPISVMQGFAAGVGLSMILGQVHAGFGAGGWSDAGAVAAHGAAAAAVVALALVAQWRWPRVPGLLPGVAAVAALVWLSGAGAGFVPAASAAPFALPPVPDHFTVPWRALLASHGLHLVSLALLMAVVNSLEVLVFNQEMELEHGVRLDPNRALRQESALGALAALCGLIPSSTSASRSRIVLAQCGPAASAGRLHALVLVVVAVSGHWWLHWIPMACLAGALLLAGWTQVPAAMLSRAYARAAPASWSQAWLVALVFSAAGGAGALVAGLVVATFVLLHASASSAVRRTHLHGQLRSRRLRRASSEAWIAPRMEALAVFELQGVMSFGVAAYVAEQVRSQLQARHRWVVLDATRIAVWDATALVQVRALARDLAQQQRALLVAGMDAASARQAAGAARFFPDVDHALESVEDQLLAERPASEAPAAAVEADWLGELGEQLAAEARQSLQACFERVAFAPGDCVFRAGDAGRDLLVVASGHVTLATRWPPAAGVRLATIGRGMVFGEMAFLNGQPRTACAGPEAEPAELMRLSRAAFDAWARQHPEGALVVLNNLALMGTRRLAATTRQLRAVLE